MTGSISQQSKMKAMEEIVDRIMESLEIEGLPESFPELSQVQLVEINMFNTFVRSLIVFPS